MPLPTGHFTFLSFASDAMVGRAGCSRVIPSCKAAPTHVSMTTERGKKVCPGPHEHSKETAPNCLRPESRGPPRGRPRCCGLCARRASRSDRRHGVRLGSAQRRPHEIHRFHRRPVPPKRCRAGVLLRVQRRDGPLHPRHHVRRTGAGRRARPRRHRSRPDCGHHR